MTRPSDIPAETWERADILRDQFQHIADDTEYTARILIALGQGPDVVGMTHDQAKTLAFIRSYQAANSGASPSYAEIGDHLNRSKGNVHHLLHGMKERGVIAIPHRLKRSITIVARA